jgi:hypothetical protein
MMVTGRTWSALAFDWADSNLTYGLGLCAALLIGAAAIALVKRWRQKDAGVTMSDSEQLAAYRSLYDQGVMSKEEFDRVRTLLGNKLRDTSTPAPPPRDPLTGAMHGPPPATQPLPPPPQGNVQTSPGPETGNGKT